MLLSGGNNTSVPNVIKLFFCRKSLRRNFPINLKHLQNQTKTLSTVKKHPVVLKDGNGYPKITIKMIKGLFDPFQVWRKFPTERIPLEKSFITLGTGLRPFPVVTLAMH